MDENQNIAQTIERLAAQAAEVNEGLAVPFVLTPCGTEVKDLEQFREFPVRRIATSTFFELDSFTRYVSQFKEDGTIIAVAPREAQVTAIIDYHTANENGWKRHTASFTPTLTDEWRFWISMNKQPMNQRKFAELLEDGVRNIVNPAAATFLDVARTLEAKTSVNFKAGLRLQNGDHSLTFEETTVAKAGAKGDLEIPSQFTVSVRPYLGHKPVLLEARLRYKLSEGAITFTYELLDMDLRREEIRAEIVAQIEKQTGIIPFVGTIG